MPSATASEHMRPPIERPPRTSAADPGRQLRGLVHDGLDENRRPVRRPPPALRYGKSMRTTIEAGGGGRLVDGHQGRLVAVGAGARRQEQPERIGHTTARSRSRKAAASSAMACSSPAAMAIRTGCGPGS